MKRQPLPLRGDEGAFPPIPLPSRLHHAGTARNLFGTEEGVAIASWSIASPIEVTKKTDVLVVIAHPDDEIFVSGTLCLFAERGLNIALVCVTDGEGGSHELLHPAVQLGEIRRRELMLSASMLGVSQVLFLGQPDTADPTREGNGCWDQANVIGTLVRLVRQIDPALILTHGPRGGYGHLAHRLTHRCITAAASEASFAGSIFSFCGQVRNAFFSWHFDEPSDVLVDASGFLRRRAASLSYHQSQVDYFLQPHFPRTMRKRLSALAGFALAPTEFGRKRVPIGTATRFFRKFPVEGLVLQKPPDAARPHFFREHFLNDDRVQVDR